jgi:purine catabolism regulator
MHLTVEQALSVYPLSEAKLVAGSAGKHRIVRAVNVMDAPDITDWIKKGEMVFTTAFLIKDDLEEASRLVAKLDERGSAGLGIKLGRFWDAIPEALVRQAESLGFPLIELPFEFTFSDQMNGLFREEMKRSTGILQQVLDKQIKLMRFALQSDNIRHLFEFVAETVGCPIAVVGSRGQLVYNSSSIPETDLLAEWPWPQHNQWMKRDGWKGFRVPLMKQAQCTGYAFFFNPQPYLSTIEEGLYAQAAELVAFHINFNYEDYFEHAVQHDFGLLVKRHLKHGLPVGTLEAYADRWEVDLFRSSYWCSLTTLSLSHSGLQKHKGVHVVLGEGLLSVFPCGGDSSGQSLSSALEACLTDLGSDRLTMCRAAISSRKKTPAQLAEAFVECMESQRTAAEWAIGERVVHYETLDLALIFEQVPLARMQAFCDRWLGGLLDRDPEYVQEMLRTLETYLACDGQLNETAKRLFIHRNTATYRIEKLGELLDVDFKKVGDLLRLKMAFLFRKMLVKDPHYM